MNAQELLESYLGASDAAAERHRDKLSNVVRNLVHRSIGKREVGDLEDFEEECVLAIWTKISSLKHGGSETGIDNLEAFIRRAVHNRYCDLIRRKRPKWYNLKLELMEICAGKANVDGFALWPNPDGSGRLCGFAQWDGRSSSEAGTCRELANNPGDFQRDFLQNRDPEELPTYELLAAVLLRCGGPVDIDTLTSCITQLTHAHNPEPLSIDAQPDAGEDSAAPVDWLIAEDTDVERQVTDATWFDHVMDWFWGEFVQLSLKQKKALLYGLGSDQMMAIVSSVGMKEVADCLEIDAHQLASLISELPRPDAETADELGIQARAVPSVRFKAWGRIRRRTKKSSLALEDEDAEQ